MKKEDPMSLQISVIINRKINLLILSKLQLIGCLNKLNLYSKKIFNKVSKDKIPAIPPILLI